MMKKSVRYFTLILGIILGLFFLWLFYNGILFPVGHSSSYCTLSPGIACTDFYVDENNIIILVKYYNESYGIKQINIKSCNNFEVSPRRNNEQAFLFTNCNNNRYTLYDGRFYSDINMVKTFNQIEEKRPGAILAAIEIGSYKLMISDFREFWEQSTSITTSSIIPTSIWPR